jgi:hypothetical protein
VIVRRSTHERELERLNAELAATRAEFDRQRAGLVQDIHGAFEIDVIGRLRKESKDERLAAVRRHGQLLRLAELARAVLRMDFHDDRAPVLDLGKAERSIRKLLGEIEESEKPDPGPTAEQVAERQGIGRRVEWDPASGKA